MELADYPRAKSDSGIGIEWSPGYPAACGMQTIERRWVPLLHAMGVSWVRFRHAGGEDFARLLLSHGIMPIVQFRRLRHLPESLTLDQLLSLKTYVSAGVRYFELGDSLDNPTSWQAGRLPESPLSVALPALLKDIDVILEAGGLPGLPATKDLGPRWDIVGAICAAGRQDVFKGGVWQAYRVMAGNLPFDFPDDPVSLTGRALSEEEYRQAVDEEWPGSVWEGATRGEVNAIRQRRRDAEASLAKYPSGWRRHEILENRIRRHLGRSIPILGTSGGCFVGERTDSRFPAITLSGHADRTLEMARMLMGTSELSTLAPGYLFCVCFSLLGNYALGNMEPAWESVAWMSPRHPGEELPVVERLRQEPRRGRWGEAKEEEAPAKVEAVIGPAGIQEPPALTDEEEKVLQLAATEKNTFSPPEWLDNPLEEDAPALNSSLACITGQLAGGEGLAVTLSSASQSFGAAEDQEGNERDATCQVGDDGRFSFTNLSPGDYRLEVKQAGLVVDDLILVAGEERQLSLKLPEWTWTITATEGGNGFSIVRCTLPDMPNHPVKIWSRGWGGLEARTGNKPELGPHTCELAPLGAGHYSLKPEGIALSAELELDGNSVLSVEFRRAAQTAASESPRVPVSTKKGLDRYLLLARPFANKDDLMAVLQYVRAHRPACGFLVEEALWAREVIIVGGGTLRVTKEDERRLKDNNCRVIRIDSDIAGSMLRLAQSGEPLLETAPEKPFVAEDRDQRARQQG